MVNPLNEAALAQQDEEFSITGQPALNAAYQEMANQDASSYYNYWIQYRNATQTADGSWTADPNPFADGGTFVFTPAQVQQLTEEGYVSGYISAYQSSLATVEQLTGDGMYDPNYVYQRPEAQQQAYINQRVIGTNTYYYPLDRAVYLELFPSQAATIPPAPVASGSGATAISANNLSISVAADVGRTSSATFVVIPDGDYNNLSTADAQLLSSVVPTEIIGVVYAVLQYIGSTPLATSSAPDFSDPSQFAPLIPMAIAGLGPIYSYLGNTAEIDLSQVNFSATNSQGQPLWQQQTSSSGEQFTTANGNELVTPGTLVMDTRASLSSGDVVLAETPAYQGYVTYSGPAQTLDLLLTDFADPSLWQGMTAGSVNATVTTANLPASLAPNALVTDLNTVVAVSLQLQTPVGVSLSGNLTVQAGGGVRLASPGTLNLNGLNAQGLVSLEAAAIQQVGGGAGITNTTGPVELLSTGGDLGSSQSPLQVTLTNTASLNLSSSGSVSVSSDIELPIGAVLAADTITITTAGALVDAGRNATAIGDGSLNLQAETINLEATSFGTAVSPLLVGGGLVGSNGLVQVTQLSASLAAAAGSGAVMAFDLVGAGVELTDLSAPAGVVWLSGASPEAAIGTAPAISAATLVFNGLAGAGSAAAPLLTAVGSLSGALSGDLYLSNGYLSDGSPSAGAATSLDLSIDTASDGTGTITVAGLTGSGALSLATSGDLTLQAASPVQRFGASTAPVSLQAGGLLSAGLGAQLSVQGGSGALLSLAGNGLVWQGVLSSSVPTQLNPGSASLALSPYLSPGQVAQLEAAGVAATLLDGSASNGEQTTNLILAGSLELGDPGGFQFSSSQLLALLGDISVAGPAAVSSSASGEGLWLLGNLSAATLNLTTSGGALRSTGGSTLTSSGNAASSWLSASDLVLDGSAVIGSGSSGSGDLTLNAQGTLAISGTAQVGGAVDASASSISLAPSAGVVSGGSISLSATGQASGAGLFSAGLLVAGGTVASSDSSSPISASAISLDPTSSATISLSVSSTASDALVLGGQSSGSEVTTITGAWTAAPNLSLSAPQSPLLLHDLIARDSLAISATAAGAELLLSPTAQLRLGPDPAGQGLPSAGSGTALQLNASTITLSADQADLAIEAPDAPSQAVMGGSLTQALTMVLAVTTAPATLVPFSVSLPAGTPAGTADPSFASLITSLNQAISSAAQAAGLSGSQIPVMDSRSGLLRLTLVPPADTLLDPSLGLSLNASQSAGLLQLGWPQTSGSLDAVIPATVLVSAAGGNLAVGTAAQPFGGLEWSAGLRSTAEAGSISWTLQPAGNAEMVLNGSVDVPELLLVPNAGSGVNNGSGLIAELNLSGSTASVTISQAGDLSVATLVSGDAAPLLTALAYGSSAGSLFLNPSASQSLGAPAASLQLQAANGISLATGSQALVLELAGLTASAGGSFNLGSLGQITLEGSTAAGDGLTITAGNVQIGGLLASDSPLPVAITSTGGTAAAGDGTLALLAGASLTGLVGPQTYSASGGLSQATPPGQRQHPPAPGRRKRAIHRRDPGRQRRGDQLQRRFDQHGDGTVQHQCRQRGTDGRSPRLHGGGQRRRHRRLRRSPPDPDLRRRDQRPPGADQRPPGGPEPERFDPGHQPARHRPGQRRPGLPIGGAAGRLPGWGHQHLHPAQPRPRQWQPGGGLRGAGGHPEPAAAGHGLCGAQQRSRPSAAGGPAGGHSGGHDGVDHRAGAPHPDGAPQHRQRSARQPHAPAGPQRQQCHPPGQQPQHQRRPPGGQPDRQQQRRRPGDPGRGVAVERQCQPQHPHHQHPDHRPQRLGPTARRADDRQPQPAPERQSRPAGLPDPADGPPAPAPTWPWAAASASAASWRRAARSPSRPAAAWRCRGPAASPLPGISASRRLRSR